MTESTDQPSSPVTLCPHCGHDPHHISNHGRSFLEEAVELGLHFDFRHLRSLPLLLVPGALAQKYCSEERARFSPPLKIYVFLSLLFFALYFTHHVSGTATLEVTESGLAVSASEASHDAAAQRPQTPEAAEHESHGLADQLAFQNEQEKIHLSWQSPEWVGLFVAEGAHIDAERLRHNFGKTIALGLCLVFPLVGLLLSVIYRRNEQLGFWQHVAFVLYAQSAVYLWLLLMELINYTHEHLPWQPLHSEAMLTLVLTGAFLFASQERFYAESLGKTSLKYVLFVSSYTVSIGLMSVVSLVVAMLLAVEY